MRPLATLCAAFAVGCALAEYLLAPELLGYAAAAALAVGLLGFFLRGKRRRRVLLCGLGAAAALCYSSVWTQTVATPDRAHIGETETVTMELCAYAVETDYGAKATVRAEGFRGKLIYYGDAALLTLEPGARVTDTVEWNDASDPRGEGTTVRGFTSKGVFLLGYSRGEATYDGGARGALRYAPQRIAHRLGETLESHCGEREAGFLRALLLGDKDYLDEEASADLTEVGIYHITAVSGLHCAFLVTLLDQLLRATHRRTRCLVTLPLLFLYALVTGASPSIVRACVMLAMLQIAPLFRRESDPPTALALALALILVHDPMAIASVSLQLSFSAVAGLVLITPRLTARIRKREHRRVTRVILTSFAVTLGALAFSTPLSAWYFGYFPLVTFLANLLCLWLVSLTFAAGLLGALAATLVPTLAQLALLPATLGTQGVLYLAGKLAALPLHAIYFNTPQSVLWLLYVYALAGVCLIARRGRFRYHIALTLAIASYLLVSWANTLPTSGGALHLTALDVGQGECVALLSQGHAALVDCGSKNSFMDAGDIAADYLMSAGVRRLDAVVLTHCHTDHANGLAVLLARLETDALYLPALADEEGVAETVALAERYGVPVYYIAEETTLPLGDAVLTLYPPLGESGENERGLTALCTAGSFDALITGDMDAKTERRLIEAYALPDIEVLLVGHHGSRYSTSEELLADTAPEVGIVSVGSNSYGHPTDEALLRLTDADVSVYRTDMQGNITVRVGEG